MHWLDINTTCITVWHYPLSYIELVGTLSGLLSVWLAARANIWTWPIGLISVLAFFGLFYQVRLYSDMLLQVYFLLTTLYGWSYWRRQKATRTAPPIQALTSGIRLRLTLTLLLATALLGATMSRAHDWWPRLFPEPAALPYPDAFTTVLSVAATLLMARRRIDCWALWCTVDVISVILYAIKGIAFTSGLYFIFLIIAAYGWLDWHRRTRHENRIASGEVHATASWTPGDDPLRGRTL